MISVSLCARIRPLTPLFRPVSRVRRPGFPCAESASFADATKLSSNQLSFSAPTTYAGGLSIGDLAAGAHKAVWVRRTVNAGAAAYADSFTLRVQGDTNP